MLTLHDDAPMIVLTVNTGSTSAKLAAFDTTRTPALCLRRERSSGGAPQEAEPTLRRLLEALDSNPAAVIHRVVHGGTLFTAPTRLDADTLGQLAKLNELAPLHNPRALAWIAAARRLLPDLPHVAVFDTAFFHALPPVAAEYALPPRARTALGVRRYGFHGLAHEAMWKRWCELRPALTRGGRLITVQLGGGCSMAALREGRPLDTSMGFSPLEGLVMATRCGDLDPALPAHLMRGLDCELPEVMRLLNQESGLAGLAGGRSSAGELAQDSGAEAQFALDLYCYRIRKYVGAYLAVLGGVDGIVFGGGVGEHVPEVRARALASLQWAGIELSLEANSAARGAEARIDSGRGASQVYVVPVEEESVMVSAAQGLL